MKELKKMVTQYSFKKLKFSQEIWENCWLDFTVGKLQCGFVVSAQSAESGVWLFSPDSSDFTKSLVFVKVQ